MAANTGYQQAMDSLRAAFGEELKRFEAHLDAFDYAAALAWLRQRVGEEAARNNITLYLPSIQLCGDNAAMIAAVGFHCLKDPGRPAGELSDDVYSRVNRCA
jgi:N6-L-threonylcarbamoyladenine synthase